MRGRLEEDPAFAAVTVESERIRLFNEHVSSLEVGVQFCPKRFCHISRFIITMLNINHFGYNLSALLFLLHLTQCCCAVLKFAPVCSLFTYAGVWHLIYCGFSLGVYTQSFKITQESQEDQETQEKIEISLTQWGKLQTRLAKFSMTSLSVILLFYCVCLFCGLLIPGSR